MDKKIETIVISLGGSLIVPTHVNISYLKEFRKVVMSHRRKRFIIVCGGGKTAREYMEAASALGVKSTNEKDRIGIHATRLNACLVRTMFGSHAHPHVIINPFQKLIWNEKILVAAGYEPGWSSDYDAAVLAHRSEASRLINLTNTEGVYRQDPKKYRGHKPLRELTWKEYCSLIPKKWIPGLSTPFDPIASRYAAKNKLAVVIMNGEKLGLLDKVLAGKAVAGTTILP